MQFRNTMLYNKLRAYMEGICKDSSAWNYQATNYKNLVKSLLDEDTVLGNLKWWAPDKEVDDEAESWLAHFLEGYQEETQNVLAWNAETFDRVYTKFEEFLYQDSYATHFVSPLESFSCDLSASVQFETGVCIREPDSLLSNILRNQQLIIWYSQGVKDWVVDIIIEQPKSVERQPRNSYTTEASKKLNVVLQSLRLLHKGKVFVGPLYHLIYPEFAGVKHNVGALLSTDMAPLPPTHSSYFRTDYQLVEQEVEGLKNLYGVIKESSPYPARFELALSRFSDYFRRTNEWDGLLDLVIALEVLFASGSYRLSIRGSYFLEPDIEEERRKVFDRLRALYNVRNSIVHEGSGQPKELRKLWERDDEKVSVSAAVDDAAEYVRHAIRKVISDKHLDKFQDSTCWHKFLDGLVLGERA